VARGAGAAALSVAVARRRTAAVAFGRHANGAARAQTAERGRRGWHAVVRGAVACGSAACRRAAWNERRRLCGRAVAAAWASGGGLSQEETGETEEEEKPAARARDIYDRWALRFSLTPVKLMLRFRTPVDCIGSVHPRLQQKLI